MKNKKILAFLFVIIMLINVLIHNDSFASDLIKDKELILLMNSQYALVNGKNEVISVDDTVATVKLIDNQAYTAKKFLEEVFAIDLSSFHAINENNIEYVKIREVAEKNDLYLYYKSSVIILKTKEISEENKNSIEKYKDDLSAVKSIKNEKHLKKIMKDYDDRLKNDMNYLDYILDYFTVPNSLTNNDSSEESFSTTNLQVEGVDEGDTVKTDGKYIYTAKNSQIDIISALPADKMKVVSKITFYENANKIQSFYLNDKQVIVVASGFVDNCPNELSEDILNLESNYSSSDIKTFIYIYDISKIEKPKQIKKISIDGSYFDSRLVNNNFYLLASDSLEYNRDKKTYPLPKYSDSSISLDEKTLDYDELNYFPDDINCSLKHIVAIDLSNISKKANIQTYLGGGDDFYMSKDNLYISNVYYNQEAHSSQSTNIYKFELENAKVKFKAKANVEGLVLNQFSMDEHDKHFRIATNVRHNGRFSMMTVFDENLNQTGQIRNIAPDEEIYSARFMGDKAYLVTFKVVDPLFAIDLSDHKNPKILGELKIPGYSDYLHPYDENHLIGFGRDTVEIDGAAHMKGMKMSMFDVSDLENPKEMFTKSIGSRGTTSELLTNHKALLFSKEKNILAFPITVYETVDSEDPFASGHFKEQAAYVFSIDMQKGFILEKTISHMPSQNERYDTILYVNRIIYINDILYTISDNKIKAHSLKNYDFISELNY